MSYTNRNRNIPHKIKSSARLNSEEWRESTCITCGRIKMNAVQNSKRYRIKRKTHGLAHPIRSLEGGEQR
jgi:hypothetical protein